MCNPVAIVGAGLGVAGAVAGHVAQNKAASANAAAAKEALRLNFNDANARKVEEQQAASAEIASGLKQEQQQKGAALAQAAGANVAGLSVEALLHTIEGDAASFTDSIEANKEFRIRQISREQQNFVAGARAQIASVPRASILSTGLRIAGSGLSAYSQFKSLQPH